MSFLCLHGPRWHFLLYDWTVGWSLRICLLTITYVGVPVLFRKRLTGKKKLAQYGDKLQQFFVQPKRMRSDAVSDETKASMFSFRIGSIYLFENTIIAFRTRETRTFNRNQCKIELHSRLKVSLYWRMLFSFNWLKKKAVVIAGAVLTKNNALILNLFCDFSGKNGHAPLSCSVNSSSTSCRLFEKLRSALQAIVWKDGEEKIMRTTFDGLSSISESTQISYSFSYFSKFDRLYDATVSYLLANVCFVGSPKVTKESNNAS